MLGGGGEREKHGDLGSINGPEIGRIPSRSRRGKGEKVGKPVIFPPFSCEGGGIAGIPGIEHAGVVSEMVGPSSAQMGKPPPSNSSGGDGQEKERGEGRALKRGKGEKNF